LAERGHKVVLAYIQGRETALSTKPDVRQVYLGGPSAARCPISLKVRRNLRRLIKEFDPDIVQANGSETLKYGALLRLTDHSRPVIYRNISVMSMWAGSGVKRRMVGAALRRMSHVASVTKVGEADLVRGFGLSRDRVSVLPIGVPIAADESPGDRGMLRDSVRARFGLPAECPLVVHVGSFTPEKNHAGLVEAFSLAAREVPDARLLLIGEGPLKPQTENLVSSRGLTSNVVGAGTVPEAAAVIAGADLLALPSLREGLPGVILEAGAAAVPSVAYDVGGVGEVVEHEKTGLLVRLGDERGFAESLVRVLRDPALRSRLGEEARAVVRRDFSLDRVADSFEALYASILSGGGSDRRRR